MVCSADGPSRPAPRTAARLRGSSFVRWDLALEVAVCVLLCVPVSARAAESATPEAIAAAIDRGTVALLPSVGQYIVSPDRNYPMGYVALPLAAVLKGGAPLDHPHVTGAFQRLKGMPLRKTYSVACYLFALDAYWQRKYRDARRHRREKGRVEETVPRSPPPGPVRDEMERCVRWLARGSDGMWTYTGPGGGDLSNSQFAVLGLEVGLQNEIPAADEVLRGVVDRLLGSLARAGSPRTLDIVSRTAAWEGVTSGRLVSRRLQTVPGGWDYRATAATPTKNMTAAGVSSLLIVGRALRASGAIDASLSRAIDDAVDSGLAWIAENLGSYWGDYYGMYSVEKVGDIGGIVTLGGADWYREGARFLLSKQQRNGTWGSPTNTAFALLFLTRATRPAFQVLGPPVVFTERGAEAPAMRSEGDVAYIDQLGGFVPVRAIISFLDETRDPKVIDLAAEALSALPPHREMQAIRWLLLLWSEENDAVTRFARRHLAKLLRTEGAERELLVRAAEELSWLAGLSRVSSGDEDRAARLVRGGSTTLVRRKALEAIDRNGLLGAFDAVIDVLADPDPSLRDRAERVLRAWSGAEDVAAGLREPREVRDAWRRWWRRHGDALRTRRAVTLLVEDLEHLEASARRTHLEALVGLGAGAVPHLIACLGRERYPIEVVLALERLTGERRGLRAEDWR